MVYVVILNSIGIIILNVLIIPRNQHAPRVVYVPILSGIKQRGEELALRESWSCPKRRRDRKPDYSRQIAFRSSANVPVVGLETSHSSTRSSSYDQQSDQIPFEIGGWTPVASFKDSPPRPPNIPLYGCQSLRLGSSSGTDVSILLWSLVGKPITTPYQHVGSTCNGRSSRLDKSLQIYSPFLCHNFYWQHNSGLISTSKKEHILPIYVWKYGKSSNGA